MTANKKEDGETVMSEKKTGKPEELGFEKAIEQLEKVVEFLEGDEVALDEALKKYEEGIRLSRFLNQKLVQAEKKIEVLTRTLSGELQVEPFEPEEAEGRKRQNKKASAQGDGESPEGKDLLF